jgi:hypothetical protein
LVNDLIGNYVQYADTKINPQSLFITSIEETTRFKYEGSLTGITSIEGIDAGIAFLSGNDFGSLAFFTTSGYSLGKNNKNHSENVANGYMQDKNDFKNLEMTFYVKVVESLSNDFIQVKARTGRQLGNQNCEGCGVGFEFYYDGKCRPFKDRRTSDARTYGKMIDTIGDIEGKWIGVKMCFFNTASDSKVKYELYLDTELANSWKKYIQEVDDGTGTLGGAGALCDGVVGQPILFGGPIVFITFRNITDPYGIIFKNISLREIDPKLDVIEKEEPILYDQISVPVAEPADLFRPNDPDTVTDVL